MIYVEANLLVVEPVPKNMKKIQDRAEVNDWKTQSEQINLTLIYPKWDVKYAQVAVSDEDGETTFALSDGTETGTNHLMEYQIYTLRGTIFKKGGKNREQV